MASLIFLIGFNWELQEFLAIIQQEREWRIFMAQHEKFYLKCKNIECDYREQTPRTIKDFIRYIDNYKCPKCSNGKNKTVNEWNNLKVRYPEIIKEWDYGRNEKNPEEYLGSSNEKVW